MCEVHCCPAELRSDWVGWASYLSIGTEDVKMCLGPIYREAESDVIVSKVDIIFGAKSARRVGIADVIVRKEDLRLLLRNRRQSTHLKRLIP